MTWRLLFAFLLTFVLGSCGDNEQQSSNGPLTAASVSGTESEDLQRWYDHAQLLQGEIVFEQNCAVCHGAKAEGLTENWRQRLPDGNLPPPPLNGSAHAWHHPLIQLTQIINTGGEPYGGQMPPFSEVLSDEDKLAAIAYFQSFWSEDIYLSWLDFGGLD